MSIVVSVLPSYYWPIEAVVIETECGHKHVRPKSMAPQVGDMFDCPFDHEREHGEEKSI